jgi:hypothetical protein
MPATYTLIASNTLSSSAASVTFSSIPGTYTDLVLRVTGRTDAAQVNDGLAIRFNGGTSGYSRTAVTGNGSAAASSRNSSQAYAIPYDEINGNNATSSSFGSQELYIPSYTSSNSKPFSSVGAGETNAATAYMGADALLSNLTSAITSISIIPSNGSNFLSGSSFFLYGIKNS